MLIALKFVISHFRFIALHVITENYLGIITVNEFIISIQIISFWLYWKGLFYDHTDPPILSHVNELDVRKKILLYEVWRLEVILGSNILHVGLLCKVAITKWMIHDTSTKFSFNMEVNDHTFYCIQTLCNQNIMVSKNVWSALLANSFGTSGIFDFSRYALYAK